ncbi:hypothetical protein SAMN06297144_3353 [Sphingomonas guangdongensis]|uniref:Uncharacterized protein n=1 Tax=Sphingomonas guangdongensis TaxID=1141890 RepID=A0A285R371_9SPHN|nr:hypothetical protein [Sphingomonas guangdongensis]SOB88208.1 hypothetical protein SAMN06297144_3353 [Sphingomonas guangdongensis]
MLLLAAPAAAVTAFVAWIIRAEWIGLGRRAATIIITGLIAPLTIMLWGAWHLHHAPDAATDMIPPGPGLVMAALPAAALCLLVSWLILHRR